MTILDDLDDPLLFKPHFRGDTWAPWRAFLAALFALPMDAEALAIYRRHTGRVTAPTVPFGEAELVIGRRAGKSRILALIATCLATERDYGPYLAPGEVATVAIIAADRKQARAIFRYIIGLLSAVPLLAVMIEDESAEVISIVNPDFPDSRVNIEINTASFRGLRSYTWAAVLCDEVAYWRDETSRNPDVEIYRALRPGMTTIPGAVLLTASSPYRRSGVLWNTYRRHYGRDDAPVLVWQAGSADMNPKIDPRLIAEAYEDDPSSAASEYGGQFRDDLADYISRDIVDACTEPGVIERLPNRPKVRAYAAFIDAAGGSGSDSMTCAIAHMEGNIAVLDALHERRPPFSPDDVTLSFVALLATYGITRAESDKWGGDWVTENFRKHKIIVAPTAKPKSDLYREFLPLMLSGRCRLLDLPRLGNQLVALERRTARGGKDSIDHPPSAHDDLANAAAGALLLAGAHVPMKINRQVVEALGGGMPVRMGF